MKAPQPFKYEKRDFKNLLNVYLSVLPNFIAKSPRWVIAKHATVILEK